ncbi:hypothetical protein CKA32_002625 [Geitlerinema sp. FC II]|nr:hypothetical protein CKA32_002625 [Geitlerinema sp. FC II]
MFFYMRGDTLVVQKSPETLVRKHIAVLKGWLQNPRSVNGCLRSPASWRCRGSGLTPNTDFMYFVNPRSRKVFCTTEGEIRE